MRRRAEIWKQYKDNPDFRLYDIYHWEAHPNNTFPEPTSLEQRITHYEAYLDKFQEVVWPGFVEEPDNPVSNQFGLFQDYMGDQTYLVLIDKEGKIAYQNSFPKGSWDIEQIYTDIDNLIPSLLDAESTISQSFGASSVSFVLKDKSAHFQTESDIAITVVDPRGRVLLSHLLTSGASFVDMSSLSAGYYMLQVETNSVVERRGFILP